MSNTVPMSDSVARGRSLERPNRVSLADGVYDILLARLLDGGVQAGSSLNIDALARDLSVSQTPIREALARLEATGLVNRVALKGYRVAPLFTEQELADLMDARSVIEPVNAYLAAGQATAGLMDELAGTITALSKVATSKSSKEIHSLWDADHRFHVLISENSGNRFLQSAYDGLGGHIQRFRFFGALGRNDAELAVREHSEILDAFRKGDPAAARQAMRGHIAAVKRRSLADREALEG